MCLLPFILTLNPGNRGALMSSYNKVNGVQVSDNKHLLSNVLREEWNLRGLVMSDC